MLFRKAAWPGLADGSITVAFRWWKRPTVRAGGTLRTAVGLLAIDAVDPIEPESVTDDDARRAGHPSAGALLADLGTGDETRTLYRIEFHHLGDDPRVALRNDDSLDDVELATVVERLTRLDRRAAAPWTQRTLRIIADRPGVVSTELAAATGAERGAFKLDVRKLKALGLTESLEVGYRLSPRGRVVLAALGAVDEG